MNNYFSIISRTTAMATLVAAFIGCGSSFAAEQKITKISNNNETFYAGLGTNVSLSMLTGLGLKVKSSSDLTPFQEKAGNSGYENYDASYAASWLDGSLFAGYTIDNFRGELEVSHNKFFNLSEVKEVRWATSVTTAANYTTGTVPQSAKPDTEVAGSLRNSTNNTGSEFTSIMINALYDVRHMDFPIVPYVGVGVGLDVVNALFSTKEVGFAPAGKLKLGATYDFDNNVTFALEGSYRGTLIGQFFTSALNNSINTTIHEYLSATEEHKYPKSLKTVGDLSGIAHAAGIEAKLFYKF